MHTPAPWYVSGPTDPDGKPCETASADGHVYDISDSPPDANGECEHVIATVWANRPSLHATAAGDAALIAAAPELLAALRGVMHWAECECKELAKDTPAHDDPPMCDYCVAQLAVAKAEGRTA